MMRVGRLFQPHIGVEAGELGHVGATYPCSCCSDFPYRLNQNLQARHYPKPRCTLQPKLADYAKKAPTLDPHVEELRTLQAPQHQPKH